MTKLRQKLKNKFPDPSNKRLDVAKMDKGKSGMKLQQEN